MSDFDASALADQLRAVAHTLHLTGEQVRSATEQAQSRVMRVQDDDGLVEVAVDGRPRVREIRLSPAALRDADRLDDLLTGLLNRALGQARTGMQEAVLAALPPSVRDAADSDGRHATDSEQERQ